MSQKCPHKQENRPSKEQLVDLMTVKGPRERGGHATKPGAQPPPGRGPCDQPLGMEQGKKKKIPDGTGNRGPVNREQRSRDRSLLSASGWRGPPPRTEGSDKEENNQKLRHPQRVRARAAGKSRDQPAPPLGLGSPGTQGSLSLREKRRGKDSFESRGTSPILGLAGPDT